MNYFNKNALLSMLAVALLTACGQSTTDSASSITALETAQTVQTTQTVQPASSGLLASLAVAYPNGQLPAANVAQASKELAQNPDALKITAQSGLQTTQSTNAPIQAQATSADYKAVTRIQNTTLTGAYFFTIYGTEQTAALTVNPNWKLEGPAFWASLATGAGLSPVHRFRNKINGSYLYTIYETEKADITTNYASTFFYEGVAWYARQTSLEGWSPLYRFRNILNGTYLFSAFEAEKNAIVLNYSAVFKLEGVAYYIRQNAPISCSGPTQTTGYSLVVKTCVDDNAIAFYDKTECVRDNTTGLIWQGQTAARTGLRANDAFKSNFDSTITLQKSLGLDVTTGAYNPPLIYGFATQAEINASTNSIGFKKAINGSNLCGSSAWRLPTEVELLSILKPNLYPAYDQEWFPNLNLESSYWTSTSVPGIYTYKDNADLALAITFYNSVNSRSSPIRNAENLVRLVR